MGLQVVSLAGDVVLLVTVEVAPLGVGLPTKDAAAAWAVPDVVAVRTVAYRVRCIDDEVVDVRRRMLASSTSYR